MTTFCKVLLITLDLYIYIYIYIFYVIEEFFNYKTMIMRQKTNFKIIKFPVILVTKFNFS